VHEGIRASKGNLFGGGLKNGNIFYILLVFPLTMDPQPVASGPDAENPNAAIIASLKGDLAILEKYALRMFVKNVEVNDPKTNGLIQAMTDRILGLRRTIAFIENS